MSDVDFALKTYGPTDAEIADADERAADDRAEEDARMTRTLDLAEVFRQSARDRGGMATFLNALGALEYAYFAKCLGIEPSDSVVAAVHCFARTDGLPQVLRVLADVMEEGGSRG